MRNETIRRAYDSVLPDAEAKERMLRNILQKTSNERPEGNVVKMKKRNIKKGAILALAAALALALSVAALAYATDLFGFRALLRTDSTDVPWAPDLSYQISITQPQDVSEEIDAMFETDIAGKLEKNRLAWNEWQESLTELTAEYDALMEKFFPEDLSGHVDETDNGDGTVTWEYKTYVDGEQVTVGTKVFTKEEVQECDDFMDSWMNYDSGYDFYYWLHSDAQKAKLEEIAEKYGLTLRKEMELLFISDTSDGDEFYTREEAVDIISGACCSGTLFYEMPVGFDKMYFYDEGTFGVSWYVNLPSSGEEYTCYAYNSVYDTLSTGSEVLSFEDEIDSFTERTHTAPDGTEVTILSNGDEAYLYVYLENSFFTEAINTIFGEPGITDADLDYIADNINYSVIGK